MTLLASWIGVDSRKPASIYVISDSRISWGNTATFDFGKKVFGCWNSPDIFGYCGDVLFPSIVLNQIIDIADQGLLFGHNWTCEQKSDAVLKKLSQAFDNYPNEVRTITSDVLQVVHCSRDNDATFFCSMISWERAKNRWQRETLNFLDHSDKLFIIGSGAREFLDKYKKYWEGENQKTSRALFHCFTDTLSNIRDRCCGGPPQLVGLYRIGTARHFGIIYNNKRYFQGVEIDDLTNFNIIEWRNELFEICDGNTMKIKDSAQPQPNPLRP